MARKEQNQQASPTLKKVRIFFAWGLPIVFLLISFYWLIDSLFGDHIQRNLFGPPPEEDIIITIGENNTDNTSVEGLPDLVDESATTTIEEEPVDNTIVIPDEPPIIVDETVTTTEEPPFSDETITDTVATEQDDLLPPVKEEPPFPKEEKPLVNLKEEKPLVDFKDSPKLTEEFEASYIVERGDNLWKIASKREVLNNPWEWKTVLIQNQDKVNYTIVSEDTGKWKVVIETGKKLIIKPEKVEKVQKKWRRQKKNRFALQLLSLKIDNLETAVNIVRFLIKDGYYAYLYRTEAPIKTKSNKEGNYYYRIRTGFYQTKKEAMEVGEEIYLRYLDKKIFPNDYWSVLPSYSELSGELIDFGIQRTNPWVIQLNETKKRKEAIADFKSVVSFTDFSYISQKKIKDAEGYQYRTRVGFFETQSMARKYLKTIRKQTKQKFSEAKVVELKNVMESAPGQPTGATSMEAIQGKITP